MTKGAKSRFPSPLFIRFLTFKTKSAINWHVEKIGKAFANGKETRLMQPVAKTEAQKTKKVLIVEDEGDICLLLNIMLQDKDMELDHVKNLASAITYFKKEQPAVVILDNKLPDGWGVDFASYVKANYPNTKIVMITGFSDAAKDVAIQNGVDSFLQKPFTREQIYESVHSLAN